MARSGGGARRSANFPFHAEPRQPKSPFATLKPTIAREPSNGLERQHEGQAMKVAFLGLGNMGAPMARNLVKAGYQVTVWNRTRERAMEVSGAAAANTPAEAAKDAEVAFTMLADDQATEMVMM
ncbi:MAG TPA: NAD(P)-binding domain-containing protein [Chthoniobacterales bacterium]|nr:NAD(P)-binding domain-containing protein [Chthoniobacterales bacterium]